MPDVSCRCRELSSARQHAKFRSTAAAALQLVRSCPIPRAPYAMKMQQYHHVLRGARFFSVGSGMGAPSIRLLGDSLLHHPSAWIQSPTDARIQSARLELHAALDQFRRSHGFGRAVSASQIGHPLRMIALNLGAGKVFTMHNPVLSVAVTCATDDKTTAVTKAGPGAWPIRSAIGPAGRHPPKPCTMTLWDDCMSFPSYMVKVRRFKSVNVIYTDDEGKEVTLRNLDPSTSELLQHECDHLDGITTFDRIEGSPGQAVIHRDVYLTNKAHFDSLVDFSIQPTIDK